MKDKLSRRKASEIKRCFEKCRFILFRAQPYNYVALRYVSFGKIGWIPFEHFLRAIRITPNMLIPVFNASRQFVKLKKVETYEQLGPFGTARKPFLELSKLIGKPIKVVPEEGITKKGYNFTVDAGKTGKKK